MANTPANQLNTIPNKAKVYPKLASITNIQFTAAVNANTDWKGVCKTLGLKYLVYYKQCVLLADALGISLKSAKRK